MFETLTVIAIVAAAAGLVFRSLSSEARGEKPCCCQGSACGLAGMKKKGIKAPAGCASGPRLCGSVLPEKNRPF
jgi:hypothetical protein